MNTTVEYLRCNHLVNPLGVGGGTPRLSWRLASTAKKVLQGAYQIRVHDEGGKELWDSGKVSSDACIQIPYAGPALRAGQRCYWQVRVWDQDDKASEWSPEAWWEVGLLTPADWKARWIEPEGEIDPEAYKPAPYLRREFQLKETRIKRARIYATSHGLYHLWLNGQPVGDEMFTPGFTSYHRRLQVQVYDVTVQVQAGANAIGALLGDGWWRGKINGLSARNVYGEKLALLLQLHIQYEDGGEEWVCSDGAWRTSTGALLKSDLKDGDIYDARLEFPGWNQVSFADAAWRPVTVVDHDFEHLVPSTGPKVRKQESFKPDLIVTPNGEQVLDFGQNIAGTLHFKLNAPAGTTMRLTLGETLDEDGNFTLKNLNPGKAVQAATGFVPLSQELHYTFAGKGEEEYQPLFSSAGFKLVKVEGLPGEVNPTAFTAYAIYSDMPETGQFECSNELVNQLNQNIRWSMKGNFLDVPTDCPQRERAGYTGDGQVFARTGSFLMDTNAFFDKWLLDVMADQDEEGKVPIFAPWPGSYIDSGLMDTTNGSSGWGDAIAIVPWTMYQVFQDRQVLEDLYPGIKAWVDYGADHAQRHHWATKLRHLGRLPEHQRYIWDTDFHFGEWSEPDIHYVVDLLRSLMLPRPSVATAYLAHSSHLLSQIAALLGREEDAAHYANLSQKVKAAWQAEFMAADGRLKPDVQATYVRAITYDLIPEDMKQAAADRLAAKVRETNYHIGTGFLSTPFICHVLSDYGHADVAYRLLLQDTRPSWLYAVTKGATTIWEFWNAIDENGKLIMSSHNHYSPGSIGSWLYQRVAGIEIGAPGYKHIVIQPLPGGGLTHASANYQSVFGEISSSWRMEGDQFKLQVRIPPNTTAEVHLPDDSPAETIGSGEYRFECDLQPVAASLMQEPA